MENHNGEILFFSVSALPHAVVRMLPSRRLIGCGSPAAALGGNLWSGSGVAGFEGLASLGYCGSRLGDGSRI